MPKGELHAILSPEAIGILASSFGAGRSIFVPKSSARAAHLEVLIGIAETSALIRHFAGCMVYLPGLAPSDGRSRPPSLAQVKLLSRTMSAKQISSRFGVSVRSIYGKRARIKVLESNGMVIPMRPAKAGKSVPNKNARGGSSCAASR